MTSPMGGTSCANCGRDLPGVSLISAVHIGDLDPVNVGQVRNLWLCRVPDDKTGVSCAAQLLDGMTDHYDGQVAAARAELEAARAGQDAEQETPYPTDPPVSSGVDGDE